MSYRQPVQTQSLPHHPQDAAGGFDYEEDPSEEMDVAVSAETVILVQDSWQMVQEKIPNCTQVVGELLFRNIFEIAPGAWKMFHFGKKFDTLDDKMFKSRGFRAHAKKIVGMLDTAVECLGPDLRQLEETLKQLGAKHVGHGILPEHYPIVGAALLKALATGLGEADFTPALKDAWAGVYGFITQSMLQGANESLLRVTFPVYTTKSYSTAKSVTLDDYICSMLPGQRCLYYITARGDTMMLDKMDKMQMAATLQEAGVTILHISKNKKELYVTNLEKYLGRKMVDIESVNEDDLSFLQFTKASSAPEQAPAGNPKDDEQEVAQSSSDEVESPLDNSNENGSASATPHGSNSNSSSDNQPPSPKSVVAVFHKTGLTVDQAKEFCGWFQAAVGTEKVFMCTPTCQFASLPARITDAAYHSDDENDEAGEEMDNQYNDESKDHQQASSRNNQDLSSTFDSSSCGRRRSSTFYKKKKKVRNLEDYDCTKIITKVPKRHVEINPSHPLIMEIAMARKRHAMVASLLAEQVFDNCLINAGVLDDNRTMVNRINDICMYLLHEKNSADC